MNEKIEGRTVRKKLEKVHVRYANIRFSRPPNISILTLTLILNKLF
jgi:hypothetical protein